MIREVTRNQDKGLVFVHMTLRWVFGKRIFLEEVSYDFNYKLDSQGAAKSPRACLFLVSIVVTP
jgi:hypothetical protein